MKKNLICPLEMKKKLDSNICQWCDVGIVHATCQLSTTFGYLYIYHCPIINHLHYANTHDHFARK